MKIIFDTNYLVSAARNTNSKIFMAYLSCQIKGCELVSSAEHLKEIKNVFTSSAETTFLIERLVP